MSLQNRLGRLEDRMRCPLCSGWPYDRRGVLIEQPAACPECGRTLPSFAAAFVRQTDDPRVVAVFERYGDEELMACIRVADRWARAGHPDGSAIEFEELFEADDGRLYDRTTHQLIATPEEWETAGEIAEALDRTTG